ncbi:MAG: zinc ribbon domain-containing protein [Thermoclostridium sp.]|nr:zinc ribbon domain-containing protein [Thermoclostridium sp.]
MFYKACFVKSVVFFVCILVSVLVIFTGVTGSYASEYVPVAGEWVLEGAPELLPVEYYEPVGQLEEDGTGFTEARFSISQGSASYYDREIKYVNYDNTLDESISEATFSFTAPPERLQVGERLQFTINGTFTGYSTDNFYSGNAFMQYEAALIDKTGDFSDFGAFHDNFVLTLSGKKTETIVCTMTVPEWYDEIDSLKIACTVGGETGMQNLLYTYRFKSSNQRPLVLTCEIYDVKCNPMPYLNVMVSGQITDGNDVTDLGSQQLQTDIAGVLEWKTEIPWDAKGKLEIRVDMSLQCWIKDAFSSRNDKTVYYLHEFAKSNDVPVSFATILEMDMESSDFSGTDTVWLGRHINFGFLKTANPAFSYADKDTPDKVDYEDSNAAALPAMSYIYNQVFSAIYTGVKVFDEKETLLETAPILAVDCNYTGGSSHFTGNGSSPRIRLSPADMVLTDHARYDVLHECGHYFDWITAGGKFHCLPASASLVNVNHGGYMNDTSSDSVLEGFASWYACNVQKYGFFPVPRPDVMGLFGSIADPSLPWVENGIREEFSVARAFWAAETALGTQETWKLALKEQYNSLTGYYNDLITAAVFLPEGSEAADIAIKKAFYENGLYQLSAGNGAYDLNEPFRDSGNPGNRRYDPNELFADIPASLPASASQTTDLGSPSDSARTRNTSYKLENSYISLSGSVPDYVKVTVRPDGKQAWSCLEAVFDNKVYIGLPQWGGKGIAEVSIPGGDTIFTGEIGEMHAQLLETFQQDTVLASVEVPQSALADAPVVPGPTGGSPDAPGVLVVNESLKQATVELTVNPIPFYDMQEDELQQIIQENTSRLENIDNVNRDEGDEDDKDLLVSGRTNGNKGDGGDNGGGGSTLTILLIIGAAVILLIIVLVAAARKKSKAAQGFNTHSQSMNQQNIPGTTYNQPPAYQQQYPQNTQYLQYQQQHPQNAQYPQYQQPGQPSQHSTVKPVKFCRQCGQALNMDGICENCTQAKCGRCGTINQPDNLFCVKCGNKLK